MAKKVGLFFVFALAVFGIGGSVVCAILQQAWPLLIGIATVAVLAFPRMKEIYAEIGNGNEQD